MKIKDAKAQVPFAQRVYDAVRKIPCGRVSTYGAVAAMAGSPNAARAVGNILHKNPYFGEVPCHRVVHADGRLADSFAFGGIGVQKQMLESEGIRVAEDRIADMKEKFFYEQPKDGE